MNIWCLANEGVLEMTWLPWVIIILLAVSMGLFIKKKEIPALVVHGICDIFMIIPIFAFASEEIKGWSLSMGFLLYVVGAVILVRNAFSLKMDY